MDIFDAVERYISEGTPLIVLAGKEYGSGSSRDWAAKGPFLMVSVFNNLKLKQNSLKIYADFLLYLFRASEQ